MIFDRMYVTKVFLEMAFLNCCLFKWTRFDGTKLYATEEVMRGDLKRVLYVQRGIEIALS